MTILYERSRKLKKIRLLWLLILIMIPVISFGANTKVRNMPAPVGGIDISIDKGFISDTDAIKSTADTWINIFTAFFTLQNISLTELGYLDGGTEEIQTALNARCLESVFGVSLSTGMLLDSTALKVSAILQKYHGVDPSVNTLSLLGAANYAAMRTLLDLEVGTDFYSISATNSAIVGTKLDDFTTPDDNTDLNASSTYHGLLPKLSNVATEYLNGQGGYSVPAGGGTVDISGTPVANDFARFTDANTIEGRSYTETRSDLNVADGADVTGSNAPQAHVASHQNAGGDEISVAGLSGLLADDQHVLDAEVITAAETIKLDDFATPDDNTDLDASISRHGLLPKLSNNDTQYLNGVGGYTTPAGGGDVTAASTITADAIIIGDDGAKGVKESTIKITSGDDLEAVGSISFVKESGVAGRTVNFEANSTDTEVTGTEGAANRTTSLYEVATDDDPVDGQVKLYATPISERSQTSWAYPGEAITNSKSGAYTIGTDDPRECFGGVLYATGAMTFTACEALPGVNFTIVDRGGAAIVCDPDATGTEDYIDLDGTLLAQGANVTSTSTTGDILSCVYAHVVNVLYCASGSPDGDHWTGP
jgi:hypothetical protein